MNGAGSLKSRADDARRAGKTAEAQSLYKQALAAAGAAGDKLLCAQCLTGLGHALVDQRDLRTAMRAYQDALELLDEKDFPRERAIIHFNMGSACLEWFGDDRWTWVMMATDVLRRALKYFTEEEHPAEFKAASQLLLRAEDEASRSSLATVEVSLDD